MTNSYWSAKRLRSCAFVDPKTLRASLADTEYRWFASAHAYGLGEATSMILY